MIGRLNGRFIIFYAALAVAATLSSRVATAEDTLTQDASKELEICIKTKPPKLCVKDDIAPLGKNLLGKCALSFCAVAQSSQSNIALEPEQGQRLLLQILGTVNDVKLSDGAVRPAADRLDSSIRTLLDNIESGREQDVKANVWAVADAANPILDEYDKLNDRCKELLAKNTVDGNNECLRQARELVALRFASEATRQVVQRLHWRAVEQSVACIKRLGDRYDAYFDAARFQWPWELWLNGKIYANNGSEPQCGGFKDVPSQQVVLLHPSIGFRYSEDAQQKFGATFLVELIGMRRWAWSDGDAVNMRGGSLVMSYSNQPDARDIGWGFLVNIRDDVSLGLVWHRSSADNKVSLVLSYDFGKLVSDDPKKACEKLFDSKGCSLLKK